MIPPYIIHVDGPMGSGKTSTTKLLNQKLPNAARVARADIKRLIPNDRENEEFLSLTRDVMHAMIDKYLEYGVGVIVELMSDAEGAEDLMGMAHKYGATYHAFRLTAPADLRLARVHARTREMMAINELPQSIRVKVRNLRYLDDQSPENSTCTVISVNMLGRHEAFRAHACPD